jgi:hypothetical protein
MTPSIGAFVFSPGKHSRNNPRVLVKYKGLVSNLSKISCVADCCKKNKKYVKKKKKYEQKKKKICIKQWQFKNRSVCNNIFMAMYLTHSSLLRTFGFSATSTYDSYLPLIFGKFALIWGHFQNVCVCRFRGHWGRRGQTASKSKTTKILNEKLLKLDEIQNLASATSKMTSWPCKRLSDFFQKLHFQNQCIKLKKMSYSSAF